MSVRTDRFARSGEPWLFAECVLLVDWLREGESMGQVAARLCRRGEEVHEVVRSFARWAKPWLFAECVVVAQALREGASASQIAIGLRRSVSEVRSITPQVTS